MRRLLTDSHAIIKVRGLVFAALLSRPTSSCDMPVLDTVRQEDLSQSSEDEKNKNKERNQECFLCGRCSILRPRFVGSFDLRWNPDRVSFKHLCRCLCYTLALSVKLLPRLLMWQSWCDGPWSYKKLRTAIDAISFLSQLCYSQLCVSCCYSLTYLSDLPHTLYATFFTYPRAI